MKPLIIDISLHVLLPTCVVLLQAAHTFCVSVLYVHVVFDNKHVLIRARVYVCLPQIWLIFDKNFLFSLSTFVF